MTFAHWVEHVPMFGRPLRVRQSKSTFWSDSAMKVDYSSYRRCTCSVPAYAASIASDVCSLCQTPASYPKKFLNWSSDTLYASCSDSEGNDEDHPACSSGRRRAARKGASSRSFNTFTVLLAALGGTARAESRGGVQVVNDLAKRQTTCNTPGWLPICPFPLPCAPPGAICCDPNAYAIPPATCPNGTTPIGNVVVSSIKSTSTTSPRTSTTPTSTPRTSPSTTSTPTTSRTTSTPTPTPSSSSTPKPRSSTPSSSEEQSYTPPSIASSTLNPPSDPSSINQPTSIPAPFTDTPTTLVTSEETSETPTSTKTTESSPTSIPSASFVPIITIQTIQTVPADPTVTDSFLTSATAIDATTSHAPVPKWSGSGALLQGYCGTPEYTMIDGPTAFWLPVIGCVGDKPDCCPFDVPQTSTTATVTETQTVTITGEQSATAAANGGNGAFPVALSPAQVTLDSCPDDYHSVSGSCCPQSYWPWSADLGGQIPCYSTVPIAMTPPPVPASLIPTDTTASQKPTSAIVNVVYAVQYPVKTKKKSGLAQNAKIGIGAGAGGAAVVFALLLFLLLRKHRAHKRDKDALQSLSNYGPGLSSNRQSTNQMSSRYSASNAGASSVDGWMKTVPPSTSPGRFHESGLEVQGPRQYAADWTPGQPTLPSVSPPPMAMNAVPVGHARNMSGPEMRYQSPDPNYAELSSQDQMRRYSDGSTTVVGHSPGNQSPLNRSEMQGGEYFQRQELQGVPEGQAWGPQNAHGHGPGPQPGQMYYEAPGRGM